MLDPISLTTLAAIGKDCSIGLSAIGALFGFFRGYQWVKNKFINIDANVVAVKNSLDVQMELLRKEVKEQTNSIVSALSEQRADFRTFYAPTLMMMQQQAQVPIRAKKSIQKRKPAK